MHQHNAKHCLDALTSHDRRLGTNLRYSLAFVRRDGRRVWKYQRGN